MAKTTISPAKRGPGRPRKNASSPHTPKANDLSEGLRRTPPWERQQRKADNTSAKKDIKRGRSADSSDDAPSFQGSPTPPKASKRQKTVTEWLKEELAPLGELIEHRLAAVSRFNSQATELGYVDLSEVKEEEEEREPTIKIEGVEEDNPNTPPLNRSGMVRLRLSREALASVSWAQTPATPSNFELETNRELRNLHRRYHDLQEQLDAQESAYTGSIGSTQRTDKTAALEKELKALEAFAHTQQTQMNRLVAGLTARLDKQAAQQTTLVDQVEGLEHELAAHKAASKVQLAKRDRDVAEQTAKIKILENRIGNLENELVLRPRASGTAPAAQAVQMGEGTGAGIGAAVESQISALKAMFKSQHLRHDARIYRLEVDRPAPTKVEDDDE